MVEGGIDKNGVKPHIYVLLWLKHDIIKEKGVLYHGLSMEAR